MRPELCAQLGLPPVTTDRLTERVQELADLLGPMKTLLDAGGEVRLEAGELVVTRPAAQEVPTGAQALQQEIGRRLPAVDLTDILVEVNAWLGFTAHLPGLEHAPRGDGHDTRLLATLLATGCNIPLADMARSAALPYQSLWWTATNYLRDDTLKAANNLLVNEHHRQWLASYWGDGTFSSSDGQRFAVSGKVRNARALPTYFGTGRGVTMQTHSSDQYAQYGSKVVPATLRDATVVLDEIVDNETDLALAEHTNCVLLWNTIYMQEVLQQLRAEGYPVDEAHLQYLSPSRYEHINRLGKYSFTNPAHLDPLHRRPLRHPGDPIA